MISPLFRKSKPALVAFTAPVLILYTVILIIPLIQSVIYSFTEWDGINPAVFVGLENYLRLFASSDLAISIRNSLIFSLILTMYQIGVGLFFAFIFANANIKGTQFFKNVYFLPVVLSISVVSQLWISIYHGDFGLINQLAKAMGLSWRQYWLNEPVKGLIAVIAAESWKGMGYHMFILYAAMKNVPHVYYEASLIDGANRNQQFFGITLPLIIPTLKMCIIMCVTFGFHAFEVIFLMTKGGPGNYTHTLSILLYRAMIRLRSYGYGSTVAVLIVIICVGLMLIINKLTEKFEEIY
ncbi:MAG: sugar ABC transporter permease [Treponema sp.]|jgi:raffinose/stachyose/melibiose transport system permease protein|nr:sugar ABC transporter permease [Treponema sp.]